MNDQATHIPDGKKRFVAAAGEFSLCLIDAVEKVGEILKGGDDKGNAQRLDEFRAWVKAEAGVELTRGEADWLMDDVQARYLREKKERLGLPDSPPPTAG